ncbi:MAG: hypothetical protein Ct9H300mP14_03500 [Gammaproteobacteria bacterium]|nr:MAG: hypothetical protein Ct9H300mP14_03500 [Gammaproteobacteria bacterium]
MPIRSKIEKAVEVCAAGGIIAYPTEYCFGLGCDPLNETAVRRILTLKRRSWAKGLIVITDDVRRLRRLLIVPTAVHSRHHSPAGLGHTPGYCRL